MVARLQPSGGSIVFDIVVFDFSVRIVIVIPIVLLVFTVFVFIVVALMTIFLTAHAGLASLTALTAVAVVTRCTSFTASTALTLSTTRLATFTVSITTMAIKPKIRSINANPVSPSHTLNRKNVPLPTPHRQLPHLHGPCVARCACAFAAGAEEGVAHDAWLVFSTGVGGVSGNKDGDGEVGRIGSCVVIFVGEGHVALEGLEGGGNVAGEDRDGVAEGLFGDFLDVEQVAGFGEAKVEFTIDFEWVIYTWCRVVAINLKKIIGVSEEWTTRWQ